MTRLLSKLLVTTALLSGPASADTLTIGYWDQALGGGVTPIASSTGPQISVFNQFYGTFGGNITALTFTVNGSTFREAAFDDIFATTSDTIRLYFSFQGVTSSLLQNVFPSIFQSQFLPPGYVVADEIYTCANGHTFCDDYIIGGGTLIGVQNWNATNGLLFPTFNATVPGIPFELTEVFTIAASLSPGWVPVDIAGAILTQPDPMTSVPGPIAGAGLPGLVLATGSLLGWWRRRHIALNRVLNEKLV